MGTLSFFLALAALIVFIKRRSKHQKQIDLLEDRLRQVELSKWEKAKFDRANEPYPPQPPSLLSSLPLEQSFPDIPSIETLYETVLGDEKKEPLLNQFQIPSFIKDNWLGVIGAIACVIGSVFFCITSGFLSHQIGRAHV